MSATTFGSRDIDGNDFRPMGWLASYSAEDRAEVELSASDGLSKVRSVKRWVTRLWSYDSERSALLRFED